MTDHKRDQCVVCRTRTTRPRTGELVDLYCSKVCEDSDRAKALRLKEST